MPARYHRYLVFFILALTLNFLFFYWTKVLVSLEPVVQAHHKRLFLPLTHPTNVTCNLKSFPAPPPVQLVSVLTLLTSPATSIDPNTHTITLNYRLHPIFIDARNSYWNPSIVSLPSDAPAEYLLLARILTNGLYQQTKAGLLCKLDRGAPVPDLYRGVGDARYYTYSCQVMWAG
ncbi:hypothetical protein L211DRAFT_293188 [Terfezia boudieri ATCC MYA-4762]|uniref:Uncharacterized protein n=1 Tax=Terfezia boudieri ATCC MYA-4762 TaxID=1051890 RepID=A0A3N4LJG2_9PEZI|nr:hypothetical protein L211DRAFT_293188 [Terfezia boudieri ATCC MYA-4762]